MNIIVMKEVFKKILFLAFVLTTISLVMDGDTVKPGMLMRFVEFFGMMGIFTVIISVIYFPTSYFLGTTPKKTIK